MKFVGAVGIKEYIGFHDFEGVGDVDLDTICV